MKGPRSFWRDLTYVDHCSMLGSFLFCGLWLYNRDRQLHNLRPCSIINVLYAAPCLLLASLQTSFSVQLQEVVKCLSVD